MPNPSTLDHHSLAQQASPFAIPNVKPSSAPSPEQGQIFWNNALSKYVEIISHTDNKVVTAYLLDTHGKRIVSEVSKHTAKVKYVRRVMKRNALAWDCYMQSYDTLPHDSSVM